MRDAIFAKVFSGNVRKKKLKSVAMKIKIIRQISGKSYKPVWRSGSARGS